MIAYYCYFNGKIIPTIEAKLPVDDIAILRGYGIFDYCRIYKGKGFLFKEHLVRLRNSAKKMGLVVPISDSEIEKILALLIEKNDLPESNVRLVLTGGTTIDGLSFDPKNSTFFILLEEAKKLPEKYYSHGAKLITYEHERLFPDVKTTNYAKAVSLQKQKNKAGALEIVYTSKGIILEPSTSNFFIIKKNKLITPKNNILIGITRNFVVKLGKKAGFTVEERDIRLSELKSATESFITATNKEIVPIVNIDGQKIGMGKVGENTKKLINLYTQAISAL